MQLPNLFDIRLSSSHQPSSSRAVRAKNRQILPAGCQFLSRVANSRSYTVMAPDASKDGTSIIDLCARRGFAPHHTQSSLLSDQRLHSKTAWQRKTAQWTVTRAGQEWVNKKEENPERAKRAVSGHIFDLPDIFHNKLAEWIVYSLTRSMHHASNKPTSSLHAISTDSEIKKKRQNRTECNIFGHPIRASVRGFLVCPPRSSHTHRHTCMWA